MKRAVIALWMVGAACVSWAQVQVLPPGIDLEAERTRLASERQAADAQAESERVACYRKFMVESCLADTRQRLRARIDDIRRQQAAINDIDRQRRAATQLDRLEEKGATPRAIDTPAQQAQSQKAQQDREQRAADHATSRAGVAAEAGERRRELEARQRAKAADQVKAQERRAAAPAERARYDRKLQEAAEKQADLARRNAERTRPRSAPLPPPPP